MRNAGFGRKAARTAWLTVIIVALATTITGFAQSSGTLTNADVTNMAHAGLSLSVIVTTIRSASSTNFDVSPDSLVALKRAGVSDVAVEAMIVKARPKSEIPKVTSVNAPERSEKLAATKPDDTVLRNFKTLYVNAYQATNFDSQAIQAAMGKNKDFQALNIVVVNEAAVADVILEIAYTFAWDYPFTLRYQNSSVVLLTGKGSGPFSGPAGAASVVDELTKALKSYRTTSSPQKTTK